MEIRKQWRPFPCAVTEKGKTNGIMNCKTGRGCLHTAAACATGACARKVRGVASFFFFFCPRVESISLKDVTNQSLNQIFPIIELTLTLGFTGWWSEGYPGTPDGLNLLDLSHIFIWCGTLAMCLKREGRTWKVSGWFFRLSPSSGPIRFVLLAKSCYSGGGAERFQFLKMFVYAGCVCDTSPVCQSSDDPEPSGEDTQGVCFPWMHNAAIQHRTDRAGQKVGHRNR